MKKHWLDYAEIVLSVILIGMLIYFHSEDKKGHKQMCDLLDGINTNTKK